MKRKAKLIVLTALCLVSVWAVVAYASGINENVESRRDFPPKLEKYHDGDLPGIFSTLRHRIAREPFNLIASLIFLFAIIHTFLTSKFTAIANRWHREHDQRRAEGVVNRDSVHIGAGIFHFLGEVEVVFGLWVAPLFLAVILFYDWNAAVAYVGEKVNFTEPLFVVVIMTLAASRPILKLSESIVQSIASLFGNSLVAWWLTILTVGPILGSFITEPGAMTISALLLAKHFYQLEPTDRFKYATIGILFVNVSVGGTLTHFAAPPVLMVAAPWNWDSVFMVSTFGWKAVLGILVSNTIYLLAFRNEFAQLQEKHRMVLYKRKVQRQYIRQEDVEAEFDKMEGIVNKKLGFVDAIEKEILTLKEGLKEKIVAQIPEGSADKIIIDEAFDVKFDEVKRQEMRKNLPGLLPKRERPLFYDPAWDNRDDPVPWWVVLVHVSVMGWTVTNAHHPALFIPGLLFFLGFAEVTSEFQNRIDLRAPIMVGFFLAGLVIHGGVQGWWLDPILRNLGELPLMLGATLLTAFNDNAAITYLSTLVPSFTPELKYAVVAGAVAGGGLTVIANAPNPAGQTLLKKYFKNGVSPSKLFCAAVVPTAIMFLCFLVFGF